MPRRKEFVLDVFLPIDYYFSRFKFQKSTIESTMIDPITNAKYFNLVFTTLGSLRQYNTTGRNSSILVKRFVNTFKSQTH